MRTSVGVMDKGRLSVSTVGIARRIAIAVSLTTVLAACSGPPDTPTITIVDPMDMAVLTLADDTLPGTAGLQITVSAETTNFAVGDIINLRVGEATFPGAMVTEAETVEWTGVTIPSGATRLQAVSAEGAILSNEVVVNAEDACFTVTIVEPAPMGAVLTLGPTDDTDGELCGETFETTVIVSTTAPDGSDARVFVNGTPRGSIRVMGGVARFDGVGLDNRGEAPNAIHVEITDESSGVSCAGDLPTSVFVDCAGVSCEITLPDSGSAFLNQDDDVSGDPGFQADFEVSTDMEAAGETALLIIDGDETGAEMSTVDGTTASFGNVTLSEGTHRVQAVCEDSAGNITRSGVVEWTVDTMGCGVTITNPFGDQLFVDADDVNAGEPDTQVEMVGTNGSDCTGLRVGECGAISSMPFGVPGDPYTREVTLSSSPMQELCTQTEDVAGNVSEARVAIRYNSDRPQLAIATPPMGTRYNLAGTTDGDGVLRTADLTPGNSTCEALFDVYCTGIGDDVDLLVMASGTVLGTTPCVADATVPSPFTGRATFPTLTLPNEESGTSFAVQARQTSMRLTGTSSAISVFSDCNVPVLMITRPVCSGVLRPMSDDEDMAVAGLQYRTTVTNSDPSADVVLSVGSSMYTDTSVAGIVQFPGADYGSGGMLDVSATATDNAGNTGVSPMCVVTVEDLPSVTITAPATGSVAVDCDTGRAGMQVLVVATTDAVAGSTVEVVGTGMGTATTTGTVGAGGAISICADAPEGRMTSLRVSVDDARGTGFDTVTLAVDTMPPTTGIEPVTATVVDRRGHTIRFSWTAVDDAGGLTLARYELRCADAPITSEAEWTAAEVIMVPTPPGTGGTMQTADISNGFNTGDAKNCVLRGVDPAGAMTPLPAANATFSIDFLQHVVEAAGTTQLGDEIVAVGDVNGDGVDDVLTGGASGFAYLYFGSSTGLGTAPGVEFHSGDTGFANRIATLGDISGDGIADFAIPAARAGRVYVFYGRPSAAPWPATCDLDLAACSADLVFTSAVTPFGVGTTGMDFDGDGVMDVVLSLHTAAGGAGEIYVVRGGAFVAGSTIDVAVGSPTEPDGFVISAPSGVAAFGNAISAVGGTVSGGSRHDLIVGAPGSASIVGQLLLVRGQAYSGSGLVAAPPTAVDIIATGSGRGYYASVVALGDVDGGGALDVCAYSPVGGSTGRLEVFLGTGTGYSTASRVLFSNDNGDGGDDFGRHIAVGVHPSLGLIGDIDGDGLGDVFVGSNQFGAGDATAHLFYGETPAVARMRSGADATFTAMVGDGSRRVGFVGDVDGDGFNDMAVGERSANGGEGRLIIIH